MQELHSDNLITIIDHDPEPTPQPEFSKDEGWYQVALFHFPTKKSLDIGKAESEQTLIYAKSVLSAKLKASKWAKGIREKSTISAKYPVDGKWKEVKNSANRYGKHWEKAGIYYNCNPRLFLIPNNVVE